MSFRTACFRVVYSGPLQHGVECKAGHPVAGWGAVETQRPKISPFAGIGPLMSVKHHVRKTLLPKN